MFGCSVFVWQLLKPLLNHKYHLITPRPTLTFCMCDLSVAWVDRILQPSPLTPHPSPQPSPLSHWDVPAPMLLWWMGIFHLIVKQ